MSDDLQGRRLLLNLEVISMINDYLEKVADGRPLEEIHGTLTVEIVKGQFHRFIPAPSYLANNAKKQRRSA